MPDVHTIATDYADEVVAAPSAHVMLELSQDEDGLKLRHDGKTLVECYMTPRGHGGR